jgi:hypothetical protein
MKELLENLLKESFGVTTLIHVPACGTKHTRR